MIRRLLVTIALALFTSGCTMSHTQYVEWTEAQQEDSSVLGHVYANSWGFYLFSLYPFVTGGISKDGDPKWSWFEDTARVETVVDLIKAEALRRGATHLIDLKSDWISAWSKASLMFWITETESSATAIRVQGTPPPGAIPLRTSRTSG